MKFKKTSIWTLITGTPHSSLKEEDQCVAAYMPILNSLFPGINYYSITGFSSVMNTYGIPALKKIFPALETMKENEITAEEMLEIEKPFLPSKGYQWADDPEWKKGFEQLIAA